MPNLRQTLQLDALASGGMGVLLVLLSSFTSDWLGVPAALSIGVGAFLVAWGAFVGWAATRDSAGLTREIALLNAVWVVASIVFVVVDPVGLTGLGVAFVLLQAAAVAGFVVLQWGAARRPVPSYGALG